MNEESCLKPGAGLGKQDISTPGEAGFPQVLLVFLRSFLLNGHLLHSKWAIIYHILNGQLLAVTCMHCPGVDKKEGRTGNPSVGGQAGGLHHSAFASKFAAIPLLRRKRQEAIFGRLMPVWSMQCVPVLPKLLK